MPSKTLTLAQGAALGFAAAYFLDPDSGARRRNTFRDKVASKASSGTEGLAGTARDVGARVGGAVAAARSEESIPPNDQALAAKVQSEVLGDPAVPKDKINIDVSDGIVALRGEVDDRDTMQAVHEKVRNVAGVRDVQNLLHLPGEPPPNLSAVSGTGG